MINSLLSLISFFSARAACVVPLCVGVCALRGADDRATGRIRAVLRLRLTAVALRHPGAEAEWPVIAAFRQAIVRPEHEFAFHGDWARNTQRRYLASHEDGSAGSYSRPSHPHRLLSERKVKQSMPVIGMPVTKLSNRGLAQTIGPAGYLTMYLQFRHNLAS